MSSEFHKAFNYSSEVMGFTLGLILPWLLLLSGLFIALAVLYWMYEALNG